jgi:hypothetical protein
MRKTFLHRLTIALVALGLGVTAWSRTAHAAASQDATITVTPVAEVSLSLSTPTYAFGAVDVNTSTTSATAVTLTNNGEVTVTVDKRIQDQSNPAGWTAGATPGIDTYALYVGTAAARMNLTDFTSATLFGAQGDVTNLTGSAGQSPILPPQGVGQSVDLWFRLDMPTKVSSLQSRTITVRFTGTAQ